MTELNNQELKELRILESKAGSYAYGAETKDSDLDIVGVFIKPYRYFFDLNKINTYEQVPDHLEFDHDNLDIKYYSLSYFLDRCINCSTRAIELLFSDESIFYLDDYGDRLLDIRDEFINFRTFKSYAGYADGMYQKAKHVKEGRSKTMYNMVRSIMFARDVLERKTLRVRRNEEERDILRLIKDHGSERKDFVFNTYQEIDNHVNDIKDSTDIKKSCNGRRVNDFYKDTVKDHLSTYFEVGNHG